MEFLVNIVLFFAGAVVMYAYMKYEAKKKVPEPVEVQKPKRSYVRKVGATKAKPNTAAADTGPVGTVGSMSSNPGPRVVDPSNVRNNGAP